MTKRAAGLIVMTIAIYLFANQTNVGWLYIIAAISASVILTSIPYSLLSLRGLRINRSIKAGQKGENTLRPFDKGEATSSLQHRQAQGERTTLHEDDVVEITLTLEKARLQPANFVSVSERCPLEAPGKESKRFFFLCDSDKPEMAAYEVTCHKRGLYAFPPLVLESKGLLGLFCRKQVLDISPSNRRTVTVYPKYYEIFDGYHQGAKAELDSSTPRQGHIDEFYGTREYRSGDSPRHIHWRSTARAGELIVKEFQERTHPRVAIALDTSLNFGEGKESTLEHSIKLAATVARYAIKAERRLHIVAEGAPSRDMSWTDTLEFLARLEPREKLSARQLLEGPLGADVLVVLTPWTDKDSLTVMYESVTNTQGMVTVLFTGFPGQRPYTCLRQATEGLIECQYGDSLPDVASRIVQRLELNMARRGVLSARKYH